MPVNLKQVVDKIQPTLPDTGAFSVSAGPNGINANFNKSNLRNVRASTARGPLASLYEPNGGKTRLPISFPEDLDNEHYMIFNAVERKRPSRRESAKTKIIRSIALPVPANLQTGYKAGYENTSLGILGSMAQGTMGMGDLGAATKDIGDLLRSKLATATGDLKADNTDANDTGNALSGGQIGALAAGVGAVAGAGVLGGGALGLLTLGGVSEIGTGLLSEEGLAINPHMAVIFKGVDFRTHQFQYKFVARSAGESIRIRELIATFKRHMLPDYDIGTEKAGLAFRYPDEFEIEFSSKIQPYLYKIGTCVLTDMNVNYNGEGIPTFFETTGAPVSITIDLTFQEVKLLTRSDLDDPLEGGLGISADNGIQVDPLGAF